MKRRGLLGVSVLSVLTGLSWFLLTLKRSGLPYKDRFAERDASGWAVMGGNWQFDGDAVVNRSDEHGAKLVTGSAQWSDITLDADLKLIGHAGDVGLMIRVNDAEPGVDAYNGYYAGLRSDDRALVIGRADYGWMEGRPTAIDGGVVAGRWYHLHLVAVGCEIGAEARDITTGVITYGLLRESNCVLNGKVGLRSMATGGAWRRIVVNAASAADLVPIKSHVVFVQTPRFVFREADLNRTQADSNDLDLDSDLKTAEASNLHITTIEALKIHGTGTRERVAIRGLVTLLNPLYIQDSTGGISIQTTEGVVLNLGDEVEVEGSVGSRDDKVSLVASTVKLTGDRTLVPPSSVTSTQAAGILFDGRLAELRARLMSKTADPDGRVVLQLEDSAQTFRAEGPLGLSGDRFDKLVPGSELRIRGVCRVGPWQGKDWGAFTILMRSMEDAEVFAGPPWWSTRLLIREVPFLAAFIGLGIYVYIRFERSKMQAILQERERLAHEMHDTLAQSFAGVGFHLQGVRSSVRSGALTTAALVDKLTLACDLVTRTHRDASAEIAALHPGMDDGSDLLTLLERCAYTMLEGNHLPIILVRDGTPYTISLATRDALFHIGREAITNVLRHARASSITMRLQYEFRSVTMEVCDNGCGFRYEKHIQDFGLRGMQTRSSAVGAVLQVVTELNRGTCVRVKAPYGIKSSFIHRIRFIKAGLFRFAK